MRNPSATRKSWWTLLFAALVPAACTTSSQGTDAPGCPDGYSDCGGVCLDLQGDGQNCGVCGTTCSTGQVCSAGTCQESCSEPGRTQCESSCVDLLSNPTHCGECAAACNNGQTCQGGICAGETDTEGTGGNDAGTGGVSGSYSTQIVLEEGETGQCDFDGVIESTHGGFTGTGYLNSDNAAGASVEWALDIGHTGTYSLTFTYANEPATDRPADVMVGGMVAAAGVPFVSTSSWTTWSTTAVDVALAAGENRIVLSATSAIGLANIDSLTVTGTAVSAFDCNSNPGTGGGSPATGGSDGNGYPIGNPAVPSAGCGETPALSSGVNYMTSADLEREYILSVPPGYDPNTPYRLVFGMHWMNGSAEAVEGWSQWFGLKPQDTGNTTIFVAPQGYTNGSPWRGNDDRDHIFFDELYAALASDLCIDRSRVFSVGFSFGAMFTNALAQTHQDVLRGIVLYAAADYNIYFPENTGEPLAFMGVHGRNDPTCPIESGRRSRDRFVTNNGCTPPASVPEATSGGNYVIYDYEVCPSNYPVRWVTFDGAHTYPPNNNGDWVHPVAWEFISQF